MVNIIQTECIYLIYNKSVVIYGLVDVTKKLSSIIIYIWNVMQGTTDEVGLYILCGSINLCIWCIVNFASLLYSILLYRISYAFYHMKIVLFNISRYTVISTIINHFQCVYRIAGIVYYALFFMGGFVCTIYGMAVILFWESCYDLYTLLTFIFT